MGITYQESGVSIAAGEETVDRIKPLVRSTHNPKVLSDIGLFGGFYDGKFEDYEHPVLVASTDGVGTKLKIAFQTEIHNTVGHCLVNHCVNDILACGAKPLFFLDYFATGKLDPAVAEQVISGFVAGCKENNLALIGGETAEMPSLYNTGEYDMSGTIVGVVEKKKIVNGKKIQKGDLLIGLVSNGLHTNGYSLARAALFPKYEVNTHFNELNSTIGEALLKVHTSYLDVVAPLVDDELLNGISHITGGGIIGNTKRILPDNTELDIDWNAWEMPAIFKIIQESGNISDVEMRAAFNLGIGMILVVSPENADLVISRTAKHNPMVIGKIV